MVLGDGTVVRWWWWWLVLVLLLLAPAVGICHVAVECVFVLGESHRSTGAGRFNSIESIQRDAHHADRTYLEQRGHDDSRLRRHNLGPAPIMYLCVGMYVYIWA